MLRDMNYFVFSDGGETSFGFLETSYDSGEAEKRDMGKPYRRESLAISPRLARILINLSQVKEKETLLDPFCGIGVVLGEAMLRKISVIGVDVDGGATRDAKENIEWLRKNYGVEEARCAIINSDSRIVRLRDEISGIATEPSLGELLTRIPPMGKAKEMLVQFEDLMIAVLNNLKKNMHSRAKIAFTSPFIKTQKGKVSCDFERICEKTGLFVYELKDSNVRFPLREFRDEQIVGRDIIVLTLA
jgi:tRNA G10  N-methylase Trm11